MNILILSIPDHLDSADDVTEQLPKQLSDILARGYSTNDDSVLEEVIGFLTQMNTLLIDSTSRFQMLEKIHESFANTLEHDIGLTSHGVAERAETPFRTLTLANRLSNKMSIGYKILVNSAFEKDDCPDQTPALLTILFRAMNYVKNHILISSAIHTTTPKLAYLDFNQLYLLAEFYQVLDKAIQGPSDNTGKLTIGQLYKQLMFISVCDLYQLSTEEVFSLSCLGQRFSGLCRIHHSPIISEDKNCFLLDLSDDRPAQEFNAGGLHNTGKNIRTLDITPALYAVQGFLRSSGESNSSSEQRILRFMYMQLVRKPEQRSDRVESDKSVIITFGMETIHYLLADKMQRLNQINIDFDDNEGSETSFLDEEQQHIVSTARVLDESKTGLLLSCKAENPDTPPAIGELALVINPAEQGVQATFHILVVRWYRMEGETYQIGTEILSDEKPMLLRSNIKHSSSLDCSSKMLYYPALKELGNPARIVAYNQILEDNELLMIYTQNSSFIVTPNTSDFSSPLISRFSFQVIKKIPIASTAPKHTPHVPGT